MACIQVCVLLTSSTCCATAPEDIAALGRCEGANVSGHVASQTKTFPCFQGTKEMHFPSDGMRTEDKERWMMSFTVSRMAFLTLPAAEAMGSRVIRGMPNGSGNKLYIPQGSTRGVACSALVKSRVTSDDLGLRCLTAVPHLLQRFPHSEGPEGPPQPCHQACHCPDKNHNDLRSKLLC